MANRGKEGHLMSKDFESILSYSNYTLLENCQRFSSHGKTYFVDKEEMEGFLLHKLEENMPREKIFRWSEDVEVNHEQEQ